jgi:beta-galactosidase
MTRRRAGNENERRRRLVRSLNADWRFLLGDARDADADPVTATDGELPWELVNLPHSVRLEPLNASGGRNYQGGCWYQKRLELNDAWRGRLIYLHFEGAMQVADVWLNGRKLLTHYGGYLPFTIDLTPHARFGAGAGAGEANILVVRLDNRDNPQVPPGKPQRELDFCYFGGLYRNVRLEVLDRLHVSDVLLANQVAGGGVFVTYPRVSRDAATVRVQTHVQNDHDDARLCIVRQELVAADGTIVARACDDRTIPAGADATFAQTLDVADPLLWHPEHPNLYTLRTLVFDADVLVDDHVTRVGIRHIRFDKDDGFFINGERFCSIGANRHQDHPYVGYAMPDSAHRRDVKKLREAGFTSVRSHYPQSPAFMDACDELGMLAVVSNPGWQFIGDELFQARAVKNAQLMVRRDRNRPSVILWEAALNETDNGDLAPTLHAAVHSEYPGDQCYTGGDREHGGCVANCWDVEYLGNDGTKPYFIREWGDQVDNWADQQSSSRVARGWGETPMLIQAASHLRKLSELSVSHHGTSCGPNGRRLAGACLWAGIDAQRGYHHQPFYGGPLDLFRLPKFNYYLFASQRTPSVHVPGLDDGPMVFIANFSTFLSPTRVTVFSNCEQVRLIQDGREVATREPDGGWNVAHPPFTFDVERFATERSTMYMTGVAKVGTPFDELRAEGIIGGKVVAVHSVRPPGVAAKIVLKADLCGVDLVADAADWVRVHAHVCDMRGTVCPLADDEVTFAVAGEGAVIGGREIGANPVRAEAGIATALVRSTSRAGRIIVTASAFGLSGGEVTIESVAAPMTSADAHPPEPVPPRRTAAAAATTMPVAQR